MFASPGYHFAGITSRHGWRKMTYRLQHIALCRFSALVFFLQTQQHVRTACCIGEASLYSNNYADS